MPSQNKQLEFQKKVINEEYKTLEFKNRILKRKLKLANNRIYERDSHQLVSTCLPLEIALRQVLGTMESNKYKIGIECFATPFSWSGRFQDVVVFKFSCDAGNGSTKVLMNIINVDKPQSKEFVRIVVEFSGVKDTFDNMVTAAFYEGSSVKLNMEAVFFRRCVVLKFDSGNGIQAVIVANTDEQHDCMNPKALPICQSMTTVQSQALSELNKMGIVELDFSLVGEVKLIQIESKCIGVSLPMYRT